jgi:bacillithiol biosynthesis cysteine-adding enzyme BshC
MKFQHFDRTALSFSSHLIELLASKQSELKPLISRPFELESFANQMKDKKGFSEENRQILVERITAQYNQSGLAIPKGLSNLQNDNCFTVCTGHQLNLFTGHLYTIYKIVHTLKLAKQLNAHYKDVHIVPVFWMASEDHDLEEIDHLFVGNKKIRWQSDQSGAVGEMTLRNWNSWQQEILTLFPYHAPQLEELLAHYDGSNLADATRKLIQFLFHDTSLIIIDGNDRELKRLFEPTIKMELKAQFVFEEVQKSKVLLESKGLKEQAFAREINLFYLEKAQRTRIEKAQGRFKLGAHWFDEIQVMTELNNFPERFSPNVMLRPVYQETILPNLCYVGGGGELAYWLQLKPVFERVKVSFPIIALRFSAQLMTSKQARKIETMGFGFTNFSARKEQVLKALFNSKKSIEDFDDVYLPMLNELEERMMRQAQQTDFNLIAAAKAERTRIEKNVSNFYRKVLRHEKVKLSEQLQSVESLHSQLFPNDGLQERYENFAQFFLATQGQLIQALLHEVDAFASDFLVGIVD